MEDQSCWDDNRPFILEDAPPDLPALPVARRDEVIVAWRAWKIAGFRANARLLQSVFMNCIWPPGTPMKACCGDHAVNPHRLRHGVHGFATKSQVASYCDEQPLAEKTRLVLGEVSLWGRVVIHESGYRAQFAYPRQIFVPRSIDGYQDVINDLRRAYGIEVQ